MNFFSYLGGSQKVLYSLDLSIVQVNGGINMESEIKALIACPLVDVRINGLSSNMRIDPLIIILDQLFLRDVAQEKKRATCMLFDLEKDGMQLCTTESIVLELVKWANKSPRKEEILRNIMEILPRFIILRSYDPININKDIYQTCHNIKISLVAP